MHWRKREKRNDQEHHGKASFFIYPTFRMIFIVFFKKMSPSLHMLLVILFIHMEKRPKSRSQVFFKTGVLKHFAIFTGKHLCWCLFLIELLDWRPAFSLKMRLQYRFFPVNIARFLKTAFLWNTCSLYFSEILCDDRYYIFWGYILLKLGHVIGRPSL